MKLFYFAIATTIATWILLLIGGIVNPMGASLACPDWYFVPTCNGELLPEMTGGVLYEHGHRLWASLVGVMTLLLAIFCYRSKNADRTTKRLSLAAVFLVALQGSLGGITVLLGLSAIISTVHLATAMIFFCLLIAITFRLRTPLLRRAGEGDFGSPKSGEGKTKTPRLIKMATHFAFLQILVGGAIRHMGAGMACGDDWLGCGPQFWPTWHMGQAHMGHRILGYFLTGLVLWVSHKVYYEAKASKNTTLQWMATVPVGLVAVQVALGLLTVATVRSVPIVVAHTAVAALLLASLYLLNLNAKLVTQAR